MAVSVLGLGKLVQSRFGVAEVEPEIGFYTGRIVYLRKCTQILLGSGVVFLVVELKPNRLENFRRHIAVRFCGKKGVQLLGKRVTIFQSKISRDDSDC